MIDYESIIDIVNNTHGLIHKHDETKLLYDLASLAPPYHNILEIGSYTGLSSVCLALGATHSNNNLFCVTQWQDQISLTWRSNIQNIQFKPTVIYGDANQILHLISITNLSVVFIDADHSYYDVKTQFEAVKPMLIDNAIVAFHDYGRQYPDIKVYCDELIKSRQLTDVHLIHCTLYGKVPKLNPIYN